MANIRIQCALAALLVAAAPAVRAQGPSPARVAANQSGAEATAEPAAPAGAGTPDHLTLYFPIGGTAVRAQDRALLDKAARLYRDARPVVMIVAGGADAVGTPLANLTISDARAQAVLRGLVARGIPADRFQVLAKGTTDPSVPNSPGVPTPENRTVEIRWR